MLSVLIILTQFVAINTSKITWTTPTDHDFGEILRGKPVTHIFEFKNISEAPLLIDNVRADCGCTAPDWEEEPVVAGKTGKITVTYDAAKSGYFKKKLTVWIKGQRKPEKLEIEGEVLE